MNPPDYLYSREHEWVKPEGETCLVGITDYAQDQLGDIVYLDLPKPGTMLTQFQKMGEIESVKSVSDLFSPVSGEVVEVNQDAVKNPELVNREPFVRGWLLKVKVKNPAELKRLLSAQEYEALTSGLQQGQE